MKVIDCAVHASPVIPALKKAGINVVVRYFGHPSWKTATKAECEALRHAGIDLAAVYETTADMMLAGHAAGVAGAKIAHAAIVDCGGPADAFVYFACDTGTQNHAAVEAYLKGAAEVLGASRVGIYGSYDVCNHALSNHAAAKAWQTLAWSNGKKLKAAALYQHNGYYPVRLGISYDWNEVQAPDVGQWGYKPPTPPAPPKPPTVPRVVNTTIRMALRSRPTMLSRALVVIPKGSAITITGAAKGRFLPAAYHSQHGWIPGRSLTGKAYVR
jgi:hypothetical protein